MAIAGRRSQGRADQHVRPDERQSDLHDAAVGHGTAAASASRPAAIPEIKKVCRTRDHRRNASSVAERVMAHRKRPRHQELFARGTEKDPARIGRVGRSTSASDRIRVDVQRVRRIARDEQHARSLARDRSSTAQIADRSHASSNRHPSITCGPRARHRTQKATQNEARNADQRRAAGRMPDRDR